MNIFKRIYWKWLLKKNFKENFVDTGFASQNFSVIFDREKQDFFISYVPIKTKDISEFGGEEDAVVIEEELKKEE